MPGRCDHLPHPTAPAVINLFLLSLVVILNGSRVYNIIKHASTSGCAYLSLFVGTLCQISLLSLIMLSSDSIFVGTSCIHRIGSLGFGTLGGLFIVLSSVVTFITSLITFSASTYYARQPPPALPGSPPTTTERLSLLSTDSPSPSTAFRLSIITVSYFILAFIPSFGIVLTDPLAFWFPTILFFLVFTTPFLALAHTLPQAVLLYGCRPASRIQSPRSHSTAFTLPILAADSVLLVLVGISYRQAIAEVYPGHLDLIHHWKISTVLLASALWIGYVVAGASQGIMVLVCLGVWVRRYWEQNGMDEEEGDGSGETALNDETTAAAVNGHQRGDDESQPLLGNRG